jgi:hypothetical protein
MAISPKHLSDILEIPIDIIINYKEHTEAVDYDGCEFSIQQRKYFFRTAKATPKKIGFFVTLWRRNRQNITTPYDSNTSFTALIIYCNKGVHRGLFILPKDTLKNKKVLTTLNNKDNSFIDGKRGFRVYPPWSKATSKQALATQAWQAGFFSTKLSFQND